MNMLIEMAFSTAHKGPANTTSTATRLILPVYLDPGKTHKASPPQDKLHFPPCNYQQLFNILLSKSVFRYSSKILKLNTFLLPDTGKIFQIYFCCYTTKSSIKAMLKSTADGSLQTVATVLQIISVFL